MRVHRKRHIVLILACISMLMLILDTPTVLSGIREGIATSIDTIIPSLLPFILVSTVISHNLLGHEIILLKPISKLCKVPSGAESVLLLGLLGGYPVGATIISNSYRNAQLSKKDTLRLLGFCNNAGPAFLIGLLSPMFTNRFSPYFLWAIHVISAILVGVLLPSDSTTKYIPRSGQQVTISQALEITLRSVAQICGWVILFRGVIAVLEKWFLYLLPPYLASLLIGLLELSNGCISLSQIMNEPLRFVLCSCLLAAGGFCVAMQCKSVTGELGLGMYLPGKTMQTAISMILSITLLFFLYGFNVHNICIYITGIFIGLFVTVSVCLFLHFMDKRDRNPKNNVV